MPPPGDDGRGGGNRRDGEGSAEPEEYGDAHDHKTAEQRDLYEEADDDDLLAEVEEVEGAGGLDAPAGGLQGERYDVPRDEDPSQPVHGYRREVLRAHRADQAAEYHVDGGGKQRGRDEDQDGLDDKSTEGFGVVV